MARRKKLSRREIALTARAANEARIRLDTWWQNDAGFNAARDALGKAVGDVPVRHDQPMLVAEVNELIAQLDAQWKRAEEAERQAEVRREIIDSASRTLSLAGHPEASGSLGARTEWLASERDAERRGHEGWKKIAEERWAERKLLLAELAAAQAELVAQIGETNDVSRSRRRIADYLMGLDAIVRAAGASTASGLAWAILQRFPPKKPA